MYINCFWNTDGKGKYYLILYDMAEDDLAEEESCVRMSCPLGGFIFEPRKDDATKCQMTMIVEADVKGYIPAYVQKQGLKDSAESLSQLRSLMPAWVKKNKKLLEDNPIIIQQK